MEYASNGKGNLGVALGAIGTGLSVLSGGASMFNGLAGIGADNNGTYLNSNYVSKDEMKMIQDLSAKDSEIALLKAIKDSDDKHREIADQNRSDLAALNDKFATSMKELWQEVNINRREQDTWNANQSVANAQISGAIATNTNSIAAINNILGQITQFKIPNAAVSPGWGNVAINPSISTFTSGTTVA